MDNLVSIIVPVYNTEKYLNKCVDSILSQTYTNLEIILVNDGSSDNSPKICDDYANKDSRVKVVHKENGGLSDARNAGLDVASGDYITFIDSDDYIESESIELLLNALKENKVQISLMHANIVNSDYSIRNTQTDNSKKVKVVTALEYCKGVCEKYLSESVCDKLFDKNLFNGRRFEKGRLNEDFYLLSQLLVEGVSIANLEYAGYNYYHREGSITSSGFSKSIVDAVKNSVELKEMAKLKNIEMEKHFARLALFQIRTALITMPYKYVKENSSEYALILKSLKECFEFIKKANLSFSTKMFLRFVKVMPKTTLRITSLIWKLKNK